MLYIIISNILQLAIALLDIYLIFMFVMAIMSLLGVFGVINLYEGIASNIYGVLRRIIDPALNYIGRFVPRSRTIDIPFLVLILSLWIMGDVLKHILANLNSSFIGF